MHSYDNFILVVEYVQNSAYKESQSIKTRKNPFLFMILKTLNINNIDEFAFWNVRS